MGFNQLDKLTLGLQRGELIVVAGPSCVGKTIFLINVARHLAVKAKEKASIAIFSLEKAADDFSMSMLSCEAEVEMSNLRSGHFSANDWRKLAHASGSLAEANIVIDDTSLISIDDLCERCIHFREKDKLDLIIIDSLQLINTANDSERAHQEVTNNLFMLKNLAKKLNIPIIISSRINAHEYRDERRPVLEDLPGSGAIDQYADLILFLYRPRRPEWEGMAEIIVAKQKNGPNGVVRLNIYEEANRFNTI